MLELNLASRNRRVVGARRRPSSSPSSSTTKLSTSVETRWSELPARNRRVVGARRRPSSSTTKLSTSVETRWSKLPEDLLSLIVQRLVGSTADIARFRCVCLSWQSASKDYFIRGREFPWLMLSDEDDPNSPTHRFFSLPDGKTYNVLLPEARHVRFCGSVDGWLITLDIEEKMSLLNPLSRTRVPLPPLETFKAGPYPGDGFWPVHKLRMFIRKVILSCPPSPNSASVALALYSNGFKLAFARVGVDKEWCAIESNHWPYEDAVHYKGRFYAVGRSGKVVVCNIQIDGSSNAQPVSPNSANDVMDLSFYAKTRYLVESSGRLLQVARMYYNFPESNFHRTKDFKVFELDLGSGEWRLLRSLGGDSLFLGFNHSMSVKASNIPGCRPNCIYFTDDNLLARSTRCVDSDDSLTMGRDMGIFSLEDGIQPHFQDYSYAPNWANSPPLWVVPNLC